MWSSSSDLLYCCTERLGLWLHDSNSGVVHILAKGFHAPAGLLCSCKSDKNNCIQEFVATRVKRLTCAVATKGRMVSPFSLMTACRAVCLGSTGGGGAGGGGEGGGDGGGDGGGAASKAPVCQCAAGTSHALSKGGQLMPQACKDMLPPTISSERCWQKLQLCCAVDTCACKGRLTRSLLPSSSKGI